MKQIYTFKDIEKANALGLRGQVVLDAIPPQTATTIDNGCLWVLAPKEAYMTSATQLPFWELM